MLRQVISRLRNASRKIKNRSVARAAFRRRLFVESLEDRRVLCGIPGTLCLDFGGGGGYESFPTNQFNLSTNAGGPYSVSDGGEIGLVGSGHGSETFVDPDWAIWFENSINNGSGNIDIYQDYNTDNNYSVEDPITSYNWDLNYDGTNFQTDATGSSVNFNAVGHSLGTRNIALLITDSSGDRGLDATTLTIFDDDVTVPSVSLSGSSGTENDGQNQQFTWSASDASGLSTVSAQLQELVGSSWSTLSSSSLSSGTFGFNSQGLGTFRITVSATDADSDRSGDSLSNSATRQVTVTDDDTTAPAISLTGSSGTEDDGENQQFTWSVSDASGVSVASVELQKLSGSSWVTSATSSLTSGQFDFNSLGLGSYRIVASATDNDNNWTGDKLSASATRQVTVVDDDTSAPVVTLGGSTGTENDGQNQLFTWTMADASGVSSASAELQKLSGSSWVTLATSSSANSQFDFNSYGLGTYRIIASATDNDNDWTGDKLSASTSRQVTVVDDDTTAPSVILGGSTETEMTGQTQAFTWNVSDVSLLSTISVNVTRDVGNGPYTVFSTSNITQAVSGFNFDSYGPGRYRLTVQSTDNDNDWSGDRTTSGLFERSVVVAPDGQRLYWVNRGGTNDGFAAVFGTYAETARQVMDAAINLWQSTIQDFAYSSGPNVLVFDLQVNAQGTGFGGNAVHTRVDVDGRPRDGLVTIGGGDGASASGGWFLDQTPSDSAEFTGAIVNAFSGLAGPGSPAIGRVDFFSAAIGELSHILGLSASTALRFAADPYDYLTSTGVMDGKDAPGMLWKFVGPSIATLLTSSAAAPAPLHVARPQPIEPVAGQVGAIDASNASIGTGQRFLASNLTALVLKDAYGYVIEFPELKGSFYSVLNESTKELLVRGGEHTSNDKISITRNGDYVIVSVDIGDDVVGTGPTDAFVTIYHESEFETIRIDSGDGDDEITIDAPVNAKILSGPGNDTIVINQTGPDGVLICDDDGSDTYIVNFGDLQGPVTINDTGTIGIDNLIVNGTDGDDIIGVTGTQVLRGNPVIETVNYSGMEELMLDAGMGQDIITVHSTSIPTTVLGGSGDDMVEVETTGVAPLTIDGQDGSDSVSIHLGDLGGVISVTDTGPTGIDALVVSGTDEADILLITDTQVLLGHPTLETVNYTGVEELTVDAGDHADAVTIDQTLIPTVVLAGSGDDVIQVNATGAALAIDGEDGSDNVAVMFGELTGAVSVMDTGTLGNDVLSVHGTGDDDAFILLDNQILRGGPTSEVVNYSGIEHLIVSTGDGADDVTVGNTSAVTLILGGIGNDTIEVNGTGQVLLTIDGEEGSDQTTVNFGSLQGPVTVSDTGTAGSDSLITHGTNSDDIIAVTGTQVLRGNPVIETVNYSGMEELMLDAGKGSDQVTVLDTFVPTRILGGDGDDIVAIQKTGSEPLTVDGNDGSDQIMIDLGELLGVVVVADSGATGEDLLQVNGTPNDDRIVVREGLITFDGETITYVGMEKVIVDGGAGENFVVVEEELITPTLWLNAAGSGVAAGVLLIVGTDHRDIVSVNVSNGNGTNSVLKVHPSFLPTGEPFRTFDLAIVNRIVVVLRDGNDQAQIAGNITTPALIDGGKGDDHLNGGNGTNIILGGDGNDDINGGNARDILIGGKGSDRLVGNGNEDILIAGWTDYDAFLPSTNYAPLWSLMAEWNSSTDQATRRSNITAGGGLNGAYRLSASAIPLAIPLAATVHDDDDQDKLTGSSGIDWFFANLSGSAFLDVITDKSVNELLEELT